MSRIKEHYHEEICNGLYGLTPIQEAQIQEQESQGELETREL